MVTKHGLLNMTEKAFFPCGENGSNLKSLEKGRKMWGLFVCVCVCFGSEKIVKAPLTTARVFLCTYKTQINELHVSSKGSAEIMTVHRMERLSSCTASRLALHQEKIWTPRAGEDNFDGDFT